MVREIERFTERFIEESPQNQQFPESSEPSSVTAPAGNPVFYRTYSRRTPLGRESWDEVCSRTIEGLIKLGKLTPEEIAIIDKMQRQKKTFPSGRWLWVGGTPWLENPKNFSGGYNCTSTNVIDWRAFGLMMDLAMMGCGTGAVLEAKYIDRLPVICNRLNVQIDGNIGTTPAAARLEETQVTVAGKQVTIKVGDSRQGWVKSYQTLLELSSDESFDTEIEVHIDLSDVRPAGENLSGFGGVANPVKLPDLYGRCADILNKAVGRKLNSVECCLLIDEAAVVVVAGNVRRCLPAGSLVHTQAGLVPIEKVRIGDRVLTSKGYYPVTNFFVQGEQELCRIKTQDGSLECTADHKVAVLQDVYGNYEMVKAKDLKPGDRLVFIPEAIAGTPTELPEWKRPSDFPPHTRSIEVPALTPDVAYFIGYLHGDGSVASDGWRVRFRISENQSQIIDKLVAVGKLFGLEGYTLRTPEQSRAKAYELQFNSKALNGYLSQFKQPFTSISVPDCILLGTKEIREAYLAGLADADGCFSQGVLVASVHADFLRQIQALYSSLGITVRSCSSVRKRTDKWEGELVTVGGNAFDKVGDLLSQYSLRFASSWKERPKSFKDHGFPKAMVRPLVSTYRYHWGAIHQQMTVPTLKKYIPDATNLIPVKVIGVEFNVRTAPTYDIEVASLHEFVCEGILVSNSAGMRQFAADDALGSNAKDNLWQQDKNGNWRIDPERDALRMANHTRVFHHKPNLQDSIDAVRKQYYSGEGAIQWAGEAVARANIDLLATPKLKADFLKAYTQAKAGEWLREYYPNLDEPEIEHRLGRYGLNPCFTADTWIHTENGARQIKDLIGKQRSLYVNGELFSTTAEGFFCTGLKPVLKVETKEGYSLRLTGNHQLLKVTVQTQKNQYTEWVETEKLEVGDRILLHNHRGLQPWQGEGTFEEGWLLGKAIDGSVGWGGLRPPVAREDVGRPFEATKPNTTKLTIRARHPKASTNAIAVKYEIDSYLTSQIEETSYNFYQGFLQGIFNSNVQISTNLRLSNDNLELLAAIQRMLLRLGISSIVESEIGQLAIANDNLAVFAQVVGLADPHQTEQLEQIVSDLRPERFTATIASISPDGIEPVYDCTVPSVNRFDANGIVAHNCGEIIGANFHCNLAEIHLNQVNPQDFKEQEEAFTAGGLAVATLLNHYFKEDRYQYSRELDPIVGVSFTGLFDFFVTAFGVNWLKWWEAGRLDTAEGREFKQKEQAYLTRWKDIVQKVVWEYCDRHSIKRPNRCTTLQPAGCLDRTALRIFDRGLLYADEVVEPGSGETEGLDLTVRGGISADTAIANQPLNLVRVELENGRILRMTPNHRLSIGGKWVRADELAIGMEIDYSLGEYRQQDDALLLSVDPLHYARENSQEALGDARGVLTKAISTPTTLNPEIGYFLGCLFGDGALSPCKNRIRFTFNSQELDLVERLQAIAQRWFGLVGNINYDSRNNGSRGELVFASKQLFDWLKLNQLDKCGSANLDRIPQAIRRSSRETILSFFCGLIDTDGCVRQEGSVSIDSASEAFIRNLQQVGEAVGLCFSIFHNTQGQNLQPAKNMWGLCLSRMVSQPESLAYLNAHSRKCKLRPIPEPKRYFTFSPYKVAAIAFETVPDYSYDFAVAGVDDDDSWYWQGALKSHNTKSLLTGASPGWHPPKAQRFIRRITFAKNDPVALACIDYGYGVVPAQSDKDENGNLLDDPFDPRCSEWLVEIPVEVPWANLPGASEIEISKFSALAQMDFYLQVQRYWTTHNTSATIELTGEEVESLGERIYEAIHNDEGYISVALLARFEDHQSFPRLPFEPISKETYNLLTEEVLSRRQNSDFYAALLKYDNNTQMEAGPAGCDSDKCMFPDISTMQ
ncbi:LAGLIDADG family homing endonuclease [Merismopedia glauca]|uniref:Ribonucleoside-triphosphate reductase n=1 Tax=Merismopedia glauca CCAP 1448/3 TaxID=1296344 RepID=A0A2T1BYK8_9CYAN|nr:LAGLIDADG family homing endonuclease [Merismopedia glauca]PSB01082.1 ribonucleoside-triphosphate reductase [Merismopedia glauca CCAP 1448/3]